MPASIECSSVSSFPPTSRNSHESRNAESSPDCPGLASSLIPPQVTLPTDQALEAAQADQSGAEYVGGKDCKITTIQKIKHEGEVLSSFFLTIRSTEPDTARRIQM